MTGRHTLWTMAASAALLAGCVGGGPVTRTAGPTPPDPPPLPVRKPILIAAPTSATLAAVPVTPVAPAPAAAAPIVTAAGPVAGPVAAPVAAPAAAAGAIVGGYTVRAGDTVYGIGRRLSVPLRSIIDSNGLRPPYALRAGQTLRVPNPRKHVVAKGDTIYGVARLYRVDLTELVRLNQVQAPYSIALGQDLILPAPTQPPVRVAASVPAQAVPTAPSAPAEEDVPAVAAVAEKTLTPETQTAALRPLPPEAPIAPPPAAKNPPAVIPTPAPRAGSTFLWPVRGNLVAAYGPKEGGLYNDGINIAAPRGTPVRAADNGVVVYVGNELRGFGNLVLIKHADGWVTAYAHNDALTVRRGDRVARGQTIAEVGSSGNVATPQLHFEIRQGTRAVNPMGLLDPQKAALAD